MYQYPEDARNQLRRGNPDLSPDEREFLLLVIEGNSNIVIAQRLGLTEAEVRGRLTNLLKKLKVDNRTQATVWALANVPEFRSRLGV